MEKEKKTVKQETAGKGVMLPIGMVQLFCVVSTVLCADFFGQAIRYTQEEASLLTIAGKTLAAIGWGLTTIYLATKLWKNYKPAPKNQK